MDRFPQSLIEFQQTYGDENACIRFMVDAPLAGGLRLSEMRIHKGVAHDGQAGVRMRRLWAPDVVETPRCRDSGVQQ